MRSNSFCGHGNDDNALLPPVIGFGFLIDIDAVTVGLAGLALVACHGGTPEGYRL